MFDLDQLRKLRLEIQPLNGPCNDADYDERYEQIEDILGQYGLRILYRRPWDTLIFECTLVDGFTGDVAVVADPDCGDLSEVRLWTSYGRDQSGKYVFKVDI